MTEASDPILIATTEIVTAWVSSREIAAAALPGLIRDVYGSLSSPEQVRAAIILEVRAKTASPVASKRRPAGQPAVDIQLSVFQDRLVCLEDGRSFKTLARHLNEMHGMTPEQYRARWGLPANYPMMAPEYSKVRSRIAGGRRARRT